MRGLLVGRAARSGLRSATLRFRPSVAAQQYPHSPPDSRPAHSLRSLEKNLKTMSTGRTRTGTRSIIRDKPKRFDQVGLTLVVVRAPEAARNPSNSWDRLTEVCGHLLSRRFP